MFTFKKSRGALGALLAGAAALSLAGCGAGGGSTELSEEPVELRFTWWGSDTRAELTNQVIDKFEEEHPNITVTGEFKDWNGYWDSLATTTAANDSPDIIQMDELYLASYASRGALLDLTTMAEHLDTSAFDDETLASGQVDGGQYALPVGVAAYSVVANTDLLDEYGISLPDDASWTWEEFAEVGKQVTEASGGEVSGIQSWGFDAAGPKIWAKQSGEDFFDAEGNVAVSPEVLADYWTYLLEISKSGAAPEASTTIERQNGGLDLSGTATNQSAFGTWWNGQLTSLAAASGQNLELLQVPGESEGDPGVYLKPSMYWSVSARSEHPAEAALFVDFLANSEEAAEIMLTDRGVPANSTIREAIKPLLAETDQAAVAYLDEARMGETPVVTPAGGSGLEALLKRYTEQVLFEQIAPAEAAEGFITELQAELDAAK